MLKLRDDFYVQVDNVLSMLRIGMIYVRRGWVNGLVYVVGDLRIQLRMLGEI